MFKKTVKFEDFAGEEREVDLYFNITKAEMTELEMGESQIAADGNISGGFAERLDTIQKGGKGSEIIQAFKDIIFLSYGRRVSDPTLGEIFDKSADISRRFSNSGAYNEFFLWVIGSEENAAEFVNGIMPKGLGPSDQDKPDPSRRPGQKTEAPKPVEATPTATEAPKPEGATPTQVDAPPAQEKVQGRAPTQEEIEAFLRKQQENEN